MAHRESLRRLYRAAVLVVLQAEDTQALIPAKAFEYLRVGRPILALTSGGATARLFAEYGVNVAIGYRSRRADADALIETLQERHGVNAVAHASDISTTACERPAPSPPTRKAVGPL